MAIIEGDRFKDKLTAQFFVAKKIIGSTIILEAEDAPNRFRLSVGIVKLLFDKAENKN